MRADDDGAGYKAVLLSGPPGIGKTTTAQIVCNELGFSYIELNASDMRSKRCLNEALGNAVSCQTLSDFCDTKQKPRDAEDSWKHCLIMDEVDGMAGNEDRGGIQELIQLIKKTQIPIMCICNDKGHTKIRSLSNYCFDLRFQRPRVEQIKSAMMTIAYKEGLSFPPAALNKVIVSANQDVRQVMHNLSIWTIVEKTLTFEQLNTAADNARKDLTMDTFDICRKTFASGEEMLRMSLSDKIDMFFHNYSLVPLFAYENYISAIPYSSKGNESQHVDCIVAASESISYGDLVDIMVRRRQNWNLLPTQAVFANVVPGDVMRGAMGQMIQFPAWLGKNSTTMKNNRLLQELCSHMHLNISAGRSALLMDYIPYLSILLTDPLINGDADAVDEAVSRMNAYDLLREDFDNIMDLASFSDSESLMEQIDSKVKGAFTRHYNKSANLLPYATVSMSKKKRKRQNIDMENEDAEGGEPAAADSDNNKSDDDIAADSMIKQKKRQKTLAKIKQLNKEEETDSRTVKKPPKGKVAAKKSDKEPKPKKDLAKKGKGKIVTDEVAAKCNISQYFTVKK